MVNVIMRIGGEQTTTMSRSFMMKKYSHCPLKKRPVQYIKEENFVCIKEEENFKCGSSEDYSEPENLSTKPQDLSCKTLAPLSAIALISLKKEPVDQQDDEDGRTEVHSSCNPANERTHFSHFLAKSSSGGPLEPLNLNTSVGPYLHHDASTNVPWPRAVPAHYPPHYIPLNYIYPSAAAAAAAAQSSELLSSYYYSSPSPPRIPPPAPLSPYSSTHHHERSSSPLRHAFTPFRASHNAAPSQPQPQPPTTTTTSAATTLPQCPTTITPSSDSRLHQTAATYNRQPSESSPLSPTSTSSTNSYPYYGERSPPSLCPEDLSSPGSVSSNSSSSVGSSSSKKSGKNKESAPRFRCSFCSKSYSTCSGLSKHEQFHCTANEDAASKKKFKCKVCEKEYNSLGALKMHIRTHTLPCKCKLCGKAFSRPWLLQGHIRTHTGEKPFSCPHCNRAFADRSNLRAHLQTHSDVKKYSCPTCSKTFSRMSLLSKHTDGGCPGVGNSSAMMHVTTDMKPYFVQVDN